MIALDVYKMPNVTIKLVNKICKHVGMLEVEKVKSESKASYDLY